MDTVDLDNDAWLTTREAANIIGCGERKLLRLIERGKIEAHRDGRSYLISLTSARAFRQSEINQKGKGRGNGEGSVFESPKESGKWWAALTIKEGTTSKRIKRKANSQKEALKRLEELKEEFGRDGPQGSYETDQQKMRIIPPSVRELFDEWLEAISKTVKKNTLFSYRKACERWLIPRIGEYSVDQLTPKDLQTVFNELAELYAPNTVHRAHTPIKSALEYAVDQGYVTQNVAAKVKLPPVRNKFPGIALKVKELRTVLQVADTHRLGVLIYVMALLGLRLGEGIGVRKQDFDRDDDTIAITQQLQSIGGSRPQTGTPKRPSAVRLLPLPHRVSAMVREYLENEEEEREFLGSKASDADLIFLSEKGTPLWPRNVERLFASIVEQAGLAKIYPAPPRPAVASAEAPIDATKKSKKSKYKPKTCAVCVHDLRRTQLTLLGDLGVDESTKMRIAGHGPKNVTMRYDRGTLERMRAALQKLEDLILGEEE